MRTIGLDAGSVSVKVVVLDASGNMSMGRYEKHRGHPVTEALRLLKEVAPQDPCRIAVTGSAGRLIAQALGVEAINEIVAQGYSTSKLHPHINTIIEMGGEDSKLICLEQGAVKDFAMNSVCAAGTGSFLDQQSERLRLGIEEFSRQALESARPPRIAGRCSVFAKSDMIHLQQIATPLKDIVAGLCFAVARNFRGSICRGRKLQAPISFQGGVAANAGMVRAFKEIFELDELFVPEHFALMGALGAAMKAHDEGRDAQLVIERLEEFIAREREAIQGQPPLLVDGDNFHERHVKDSRDIVHALNGGPRKRAYLGIDIGSISTNLAVVDDEGKLLSKRYLMTAGQPIEAVRLGLREVFDEVGHKVDIAGVGTTGSGRYMISDYVGADIVKNEITAQATAATFIDPDVDTIFEIGGQDSKYIAMRDGVIVEFEMNKACAAGTGSFLEEQAEKLDISVKGQFADCAFCSDTPTRLGERCTVFMENSLMANLQRGVHKDNLLAGLAYSIVQNYINRVVAGRPIGKKIFFQGGVAFNKSVVAAFEKHLGVEVTVPPNHDVTGAIGMALIAMRHMRAAGDQPSAFKGIARTQTPYELSSFECKSCSNLCEINRVKIDGEQAKLFYGGRCEKYDINRKDTSAIPDLFKFRDEHLWQPYNDIKAREATNGSAKRAKIGIPYIFYFNEHLPFWVTLMDELGFDVEVSPKPNRQVVDLGLEAVLSEACYPVKVSLGHLRYLHELGGIDAVLSPSFVNLNKPGDEYSRGVACPHTQTIPYVGRVAVPGIKMLTPVVDFSRGHVHLASEIQRSFKEYNLKKANILKAILKAETAQEAFYEAMRVRGKEALAAITEKSVVIVGRSYNAFERGMNLQIPEKLATLGVQAIPMEMLPLDTHAIEEHWPNMYWRSGQKIIRAARYIANHPQLYPLFIGNFSCGPDSFILKYFKDELRGKPFLHIEIDEHSADAGAVTRCEAFLDSIGHRRDRAHDAPPQIQPTRSRAMGKRIVYIPRMADHSLAIAIAFERAGVEAYALPEPDRNSVEVGMQYVSGKECYPCVVTTGDMIKKTQEPDFDPARAAFFMPSGTGPCRFGQYNVFHSSVLKSIGLEDVPVFAPNQNEHFYSELGIVGKNFALDAWRGIVAIELLQKCLHETRPYEREKGMCDSLYSYHLDKIVTALRQNDSHMHPVLKAVRRDFESVVRTGERRPLVGVVGEIYVRSNRFSNENLVRKVEALGGQAWLAPIEEWIYYVNSLGLRKALINKDGFAMLDTLVKRFFKKRVEHRYARHFEGYLKSLHEPATKDIFQKAAPYVHDSFEGETVLSIGKAVDLAQRGAHGIINAMPFGCMPGTIVTALSRALSKDFDIPFISMPYDGTESSTLELQLEAFMDQTRQRMTRKSAVGIS